ncbi:hypothetical protein LEN26_000093 [Aphanomyces euteiches]|nr:hypothetical protein AeMF1_001587 [Aphanomyces euteiches]KAH9164321.1 hypothetical protein LEN26_000093 [Aphanomyces euteiches]KAH9190758.1 hypothetical protein AeNC1_007258 [Aphanomyces euteiches]
MAQVDVGDAGAAAAIGINGTHEHFHMKPGLAGARFVFTILSILGCLLIVLSYLLFLPLRKGVNAIVVSIALCAMGMHITMLAQTGYHGPAAAPANGDCNTFIAAMTQFFVLGQEMYLFTMILDLYSTTRNPFTYTRTIFYHLFVLALALVCSYVFSVNGRAVGFTDLGICWFRSEDNDASVWLHIYFVAPVAFLYGKGFMLFIVARNRIQDGYDDITTSAARILSLRHMRVYIIVATIYWVVMGMGSIAILFWINLPNRIETFYHYWMAGLSIKGIVIFVVYAYLMKLSTVYAMWRQGNYDDLMNIQGVQWVLRRDVLYFARMGICESISSAVEWIPEGSSNYAVRSLELIGRHETHKAVFHEFEAASFALIRSLSGITSEQLGHSMRVHTQERFSEGKSGAFLYYTGDQKFIVKTCTQAEQAYLMQILPSYIAHLQTYPNSFLSRYVGCYELVVYDQTIRFIVLANILQNPSVVVDEFYDLKGSWVGRYANPFLLGVRKVCKYCGKEFVVGMTREDCLAHPKQPSLGHVQDICGKDLNWGARQISLHEDVAEAIADQLATDSEFLRSINSIDYSLIVGLHTYGGNDEGGDLTTESDIVQDNMATAPTTSTTNRDPYDLTMLGMNKKRLSIGSSSAGGLFSSPTSGDVKTAGYVPMSSTKHSPNVGNTAPGLNDCVVYMGIIDILTPWSMKKQLEHWFRVYIQTHDRLGISCVDPKYYAQRFRERVINTVVRGRTQTPAFSLHHHPSVEAMESGGRQRLNLKLLQPQMPEGASARLPTMVASDFTGSHFVWDHQGRPSSAKSNMSSFPSSSSGPPHHGR